MEGDQENPRNLSKEELEKEKEEDEKYIKQLEIAQYKIRGKPELYTAEIQNYSEDFKTFFVTVKEQPLSKNKKFAELAIFLSRLAQFFKTDLSYLQDYVQEFLEHYSSQMNPFLRKKMVSSYMIMRAQNLILPYKALSFLFKLFSVPDKELRKMVSSHIINDLKRMNKHHRNEKINKQLQNYIFEILKKNNDILAKRSLQLMISMFKKCIWNDAKTINIIAQGCFNDYYKVRLTACYFLIETTENIQDIDTSDDEDEEDEGNVGPREKLGAKKTKARQMKLEKEKKKHQKKERKKLVRQIKNSFFPIDQVYNPQEFAERLFTLMRKSNDRFGSKLVYLSVISRMINRHKLLLVSFYSFIQKYLVPHQKEVTKIMAYLAEAVHDLISYEDLAPIMKQIVDNFVNQRCSDQAMTMGLNTIREMCSKNWYILDKFTLNYLCDYWGHKNRNVSKGAKALINLYREKNPMLLERKYRGRYDKNHKNIPTEQDEVIPSYNIEKPKNTIEGAELIDEGQDLPVFLDRVMTDEDFKKIRFLQQKKKQEELQKRYDYSSGDEQEEDDDEDEDDEDYAPEENKLDEEDKNSDISDLDSGDEQDEQIEFAEGGDDDNGDDDGFETESEEVVVDENMKEILEQRQKRIEEEKSAKLKMENQKRKRQELEEQLEDGYDSFDDDEDDVNPHGFISEEAIKRFRKRKAERREDARKALEEKDKFKYKKKDKKGGSTNTEKLKNKNTTMRMEKKHRQRKKQEGQLSVKNKIKTIKNQLGHVRSKSQFQKTKKKKQQKFR